MINVSLTTISNKLRLIHFNHFILIQLTIILFEVINTANYSLFLCLFVRNI